MLRAGTDLFVVCGYAGTVVGVITKTAVLAYISECECVVSMTAAALAMSTDVLRCTPDDLVKDVWSKMRFRDFKNVLVVDTNGRPLGVLSARDALGILLQEVKIEESLLRDYVMGVGYR